MEYEYTPEEIKHSMRSTAFSIEESAINTLAALVNGEMTVDDLKVELTNKKR